MTHKAHELCDCPEKHPTPDGRCANTSLRSESNHLTGYTACGCCVADCPDVHPIPTGRLKPVPGSTVIAAEYVATLPIERQQDLRERAARGELHIRPRPLR